ncbi:hypothetical protein ACH9L7_13725 [Haloferax sp. S1W]|uniref:hypothetical protein n=1 Tax=Haloferax sp. S1W TaxID=3377110 RepID=UPI0037C638A0
MTAAGLLVFGDRERRFDDIPPVTKYAVRHVRDRFDRDAFYDAVSDPTDFVFFGVAPCNLGLDYDWARLPPFLGHAVWTDEQERLLPVDAAEQAFERLGLDPVNTVEKEVNVRDFHPSRYEIPDSMWGDGPAAGIIVENRRGGRALLRNPVLDDRASPEPIRDDAASVADRLVTDDRLERAVDAVESAENPVTTEAVHARVFEMVAREEYVRLDKGGVDWDALRSAVGSVVGAALGREGADG